MSRSNHVVAVTFLACALHCISVSAAEAPVTLWTATEAETFCAALPPVDATQLDAIAGPYAPVLARNAPTLLSNLRLLDDSAADTLLQRAIANGWGILDMLSDVANLEGGTCSLLMTAATLQKVDQRYNLHGLWMINAPVRDTETLAMSYIVFGSGKLVMAYPAAATIKVDDYAFFGGKYAYTPFVMANIVNAGDARGLDDIQVLESPEAPSGAFKGPRGSSIRSMLLDDDRIDVHYTVFGIASAKTVARLPIERR